MIVILNAGARKAKSGNLQPTIAELFGAAGVNAEIISVAGKDVSTAAKQAVAENHETIVAAGGEGTVNTVTSEVAGTEKMLGVLPLGTLNHFAKDLHLPLRLEGAVRTIWSRSMPTMRSLSPTPTRLAPLRVRTAESVAGNSQTCALDLPPCRRHTSKLSSRIIRSICRPASKAIESCFVPDWL